MRRDRGRESSVAFLQINLSSLGELLVPELGGNAATQGGKPDGRHHPFTLRCSFTLARRRGELRLLLPGSPTVNDKPMSPLVKSVVTAHDWNERILSGEIYSIRQLADEAKLNARYAARILRLAALSPDIIREGLDAGSMANHLLGQFMRRLPLIWTDQAAHLQSKPS